ncbi:MAG: hypothetical protein QM632_06895 [Micrococcaceae bacterium]
MSYLYLNSYPRAKNMVFKEELSQTTFVHSWIVYDEIAQKDFRLDFLPVVSSDEFATLSARWNKELAAAPKFINNGVYEITIGPLVSYRNQKFASILRKTCSGNPLSFICESKEKHWGQAMQFLMLSSKLLLQFRNHQHGYLSVDSFVFDGEKLHITDPWLWQIVDNKFSYESDTIALGKIAWQIVLGVPYSEDNTVTDFCSLTGAEERYGQFIVDIIKGHHSNPNDIRAQAKSFFKEASAAGDVVDLLKHPRTMVLQDTTSQFYREDLPTKDCEKITMKPVNGYEYLDNTCALVKRVSLFISGGSISLALLATGIYLML